MSNEIYSVRNIGGNIVISLKDFYNILIDLQHRGVEVQIVSQNPDSLAFRIKDDGNSQ